MAKASKFLREKFMNVHYVEGCKGGEIVAEISHVAMRPVGKEKRLVLYLNDAHPGLPLNDARIADLIAIHGGDDETDNWRKTEIRIIVDYSIEYQGDSVGGVRIAKAG